MMRIAISLMLAVLLLGACSRPKLLDFRNAEISNGMIYAGGANAPYTGKLTNLPWSQMPTEALSHIRQVISTLLATEKDVESYNRVRNATSSALCDVDVKEGRLEGKAVCSLPNGGGVLYVIPFTQGNVEGELLALNPLSEGMVVAKAPYLANKLHGASEVYSPVTGKLIHRATWENGVAQGLEERLDGNTGEVTFRAMIVNGRYDGNMETLNKETGKLEVTSTWVNGVKQLPPVSEAAPEGKVEACVDGKIAAFHQEQGEDAPIINDVLQEWKLQCAVGS
ncbi:toxin-antitoxin system YwqK family antitoxin [Chitinimonas taiwanensis]|uniref:toxin-antitoxin system YwqK family antitoxin n=1 Tax=Chitinimonas taiwanensis TaxID=240412 RepID=UPI0035B41C9E